MYCDLGAGLTLHKPLTGRESMPLSFLPLFRLLCCRLVGQRGGEEGSKRKDTELLPAIEAPNAQRHGDFV